MATEGKRSKGRFLYLFDWNAKSKKKLFSNKTESSEESNQGKENGDNMVISQYLMREMRENGNHSSFRGNANYNYASSGNGDDDCGARPPGVVARLMGLDTMPTTTPCEASSVSPYESPAVNNSYYSRGAVSSQQGHHIMDYSYPPSKVDGFSWNSPRTSKFHGRAIERFQTEVLPPKSAKPISVTHHKLLSPIKSPGFVPSNNAAYIMEAAARIIDPSPQISSRAKISSLGSPSSSFRMQDLKDRMDAAQRSFRLPETPKTPKQSPRVHQVKGTSSDRSSHRSLFRNIMGSQTSNSQKVKSKGKSIPVPAQNKANVQKREGLASSDSRGRPHKERKKVTTKQKEPNVQKELNTQKAGPSRSSRKRTSGALRQNNDKQNTVSHRDKPAPKSTGSDPLSRKTASSDKSTGASRIVNKVFVNAENGSKKAVSTTISTERRPLNGITERRPSLNKMKNISRSKQVPNRVDDLGECLPDGKGRRTVQRDRSPRSDSRKDMDVISFTFTSPIKNSGSQSLQSAEANGTCERHVCGDTNDSGQADAKTSSSTPTGLKLIDSGSLSRLLEQKLQELTDKIGSAKSDSMIEGPDTDSISCMSASISLHGLGGTVEYDDWSDKDQTSATFDDDCSSSIVSRSTQKWEDFEGIEEHNVIGTNKEANQDSELGKRNLSIPECSISGSWMSATTSDFTYGYDEPSSARSQEVMSSLSTEDVHPKEDEAQYDTTTYWELEYVRYMLHYAGLKGSGLVEDSKIIDPGLFDLLENLINASGRTTDQCSKLEREILFDCVCESVSIRHERATYGSYNAWVKWGILLQNEWLTEEVYKEILCWQSMGNLMVDELVDWDMSTPSGKWLDFEFESLEEGMDIEEDIVASLVDELVTDLSVQILSR